MAKLKKMPSPAVIGGFRGVIDYYVHNGIPCARTWPRTPGPKRSPEVEAQWPAFRYIAGAWNTLSPELQEAYRLTASGTNLSGRDYFTKNYITHDYLELSASPPTPSPPGAGYFYLKTIAYYTYPLEPRVVTTSDTEAHLTLYWTNIEPVKHPRTRIVRGIAVPWYTRFCFVAWHAVEQDEPGDTLVHSFTMPDWLPCQTRWFTFRGTIETALSPSVGPIFKHHMLGLTVKVFPVRSTDARLRNRVGAKTYTGAHDTTDGEAMDKIEIMALGQSFSEGYYWVWRTALFFDTSTIPPDAKIHSATLSFSIAKAWGWDYHFVIVSGDDLSEPPIAKNYHDLLDDTISLGQTIIISAHAWHHITLNHLGLAKINRTGITKLALRTNEDIAAIPPPTDRYAQVHSFESFNPSYLTIAYL